MSPLDGLGDPPGREDQRQLAGERLQTEAQRLVALGREAAQLGASSGASATELVAHPTLPPGGILVAAHASLLRLLSLSSASTLLELPEDLQSGQLPPPALDALLAEIDAREASGSDFAAAQEEWLARLSRDNPSAADPVFRTFFAGVSQSLRLARTGARWTVAHRTRDRRRGDRRLAAGALADVAPWRPGGVDPRAVPRPPRGAASRAPGSRVRAGPGPGRKAVDGARRLAHRIRCARHAALRPDLLGARPSPGAGVTTARSPGA